MKLPSLQPGYEPSGEEEYMCPEHLAYFQSILLKWKNDLLQTNENPVEEISNLNLTDPSDKAVSEVEAERELRLDDRKRRLLSKIDKALERIESGEYGYCEQTGEPIGLSRLKARPIATLCIDAQEQYEKSKKHFLLTDPQEIDSDDS